MLDDVSLKTLAERMLADYDNATPGTVFGEGLRLKIDEAWQLQAAVAALREARGEQVVGYKIGCVFEGNQKMMGLSHPAYGRLWSTEMHETGATLSKARYSNPSMEAEFAITLSGPVTPGMKTSADLLLVIASIHPVIEIHNLTMRGEAPHGHELLANNAILAGVVWGPPVHQIQDVTTTDLKLIYDGETIDAWDDLTWPDDMISAIGWLAEKLDAQGKSLRAGDRLLMGAWGPPIPMAERSRVEVTSSAFGTVSATFV
ncbi:MAG: hypothetical protein AAFP68_01515 [Pseudomonadota bacterium]